MEYSEMQGIDKFAMYYGIAILAIFCFMVLINSLVVIYLAPKVSKIAVTEQSKAFLQSRIYAYKSALIVKQNERK